jgi:hypothetical protein
MGFSAQASYVLEEPAASHRNASPDAEARVFGVVHHTNPAAP